MMKKRTIFQLVLAVILMVGFTLGEAGPGENIPPQGAQITKATDSPALSAVPQTIALEPFYLIHEKGAKVWIERVIVTVEVNQGKPQAADFNNPEQEAGFSTSSRRSMKKDHSPRWIRPL